MPEPGGPTTQSGINYQNAVAAHWVGRLLCPAIYSEIDRATSVQIESSDFVDDLVVGFASGRTEFRQIKETLQRGTPEWDDVWINFFKQHQQDVARLDQKFILTVSRATAPLTAAFEICHRASSYDVPEDFGKSLSSTQKNIFDEVLGLLKIVNLANAHKFFRKVGIEFLSNPSADASALAALPESNVDRTALFGILYEFVSTSARSRARFTRMIAATALREKYGVSLTDTAKSSPEVYLATLQRITSRIGVPGTDFSGPVDQWFVWPTFSKVVAVKTKGAAELEAPDPEHLPGKNAFDLQNFPSDSIRSAIVSAPAGAGKTTMLTALTHQLIPRGYLPCIISIDHFQEERCSVIDYLQHQINRKFDAQIDWRLECGTGRAIILFDGLDELAPRDRADAIENIQQFTARHTEAAWLLTVRDPSALTGALDCQRFRMEPLKSQQIRQYIQAASGLTNEELPTNSLVHTMGENSSYLRLLQIPLLLALATYLNLTEGKVATSRSEVLDRYVTHMLSSLKRPGKQDGIDASELRKGAEALAFEALCNDRTYLNARDATAALQATLPARASQMIDTLVACGVIKSANHTYSFQIPLVQEYLAASHMTEQNHHNIVTYANRLVLRPWGQALQLALEISKASDAIIGQLLQLEDDAFGSLTQLIGQSIVNGAPANPATKEEIGNRLVDVWRRSGHAEQAQVARILASGFSNPLPIATKAILKSGPLLNGYERLLNATNDVNVIRDFILPRLRPSISHRCSIRGLGGAISKMPDFIEVAVRAVQEGKAVPRIRREIGEYLATASVDVATFEKWMNDRAFPTRARLMFASLPGVEPNSYIARIFRRYLRQHPSAVSLDGKFEADLIAKIGDPLEEMRAVAQDRSASKRARAFALIDLMTLAHKRWGRAARIVELNATKIQDDDPLFPDWLRFCAIEGDRKAQVEFVRRASSGDYEYVRLFLLIARRLEPQITSQISLDGVVAHEYSSKELLDIAQGLCGETGRGMRDGRADVRLPVDEEILEHFSSDALDAFYEKLLKFASDMKPGADRIRAFMYAFQLASKTDEHDALNKVLAEVDTALRSSVDQETAKAVEDALSRMRTEQIPKDIPERIAMVCGNWSLIMDQIIKDPGIDALRALLELQSRIPQQRQQHLEDRIKSMSIRIGVKVLRWGNRLALSAQI